MRVLCTLLALLFAHSAAATQDAWPALYDVSGVAADDVLNIRTEPRADARIIGALGPETRGVELIRPNDRHTWALVNTRDGTGWVSLSFMRRQPGQWYGSIPPIAQCFGTEPFWRLSLQAPPQWETPDGNAPVAPLRGMVAENRADRFVFESGAAPHRMTAFVRIAACSDGMTGREFGYEADILRAGADGIVVYFGCCSLMP